MNGILEPDDRVRYVEAEVGMVRQVRRERRYLDDGSGCRQARATLRLWAAVAAASVVVRRLSRRMNMQCEWRQPHHGDQAESTGSSLTRPLMSGQLSVTLAASPHRVIGSHTVCTAQCTLHSHLRLSDSVAS